MAFNKQLIEKLIFSQDNNILRFTQDSPIYPDVWLDYFEHRENPNYRADLILIPHKKSSAADLFRELNKYLFTTKENDEFKMANGGDSVAIKLTFIELITIVLPMTNWWQTYLYDQNNKPTAHFKWLTRIIYAILFEYEGEIDSELQKEFEKYWRKDSPLFTKEDFPITLWSINRNRKATLTIETSVPTTKADASRRLFDIDGTDIVWAIMDSGIDARHQAFRQIDKKTLKLCMEAMGLPSDKRSNNTRIMATYDFTKFRQVLSDAHTKTSDSNSATDQKEIVGASSDKNDTSLSPDHVSKYLEEISHNLKFGRILDWSIIAPLLRIAHNNQDYIPPAHPHGTHVAGIVGANQPEMNLIGMCPGISLYDIRVMDADGEAEEFNILAAIQFLRWLNNQKDNLSIHGVNMSFSMKHEVASYACGQTPVCIAAERLVAEGTIVVAAAGNQGQTLYQSTGGSFSQGFRMVNITDPGNAQRVITVGATHRNQPHAYGVSYFSSKGPTGDGRIKPDLVAPGEKIVSAIPNDGQDRMDGTSMAAPHVSGAAALILAKHRELIGKPDRIKEILCSTATDLGREKYFQGCGMLDVLRAIQSI
jgi:serine protease AprX